MKPAPSTTWLAACAAALLAGPALASEGPADDRSTTPGLAVAVESGRYRGGYGAALAYYQPLPALPRLGLGAGANAGLSGFEPRTPAWGLNLFAAYGRQQRALVLLGWALNDRSVLRLHGSNATERFWWGPEASAGYEMVSAPGATVRILLGLAYVPRRATPPGDRYRRTLTVALGWKLW
jgi:hypothetical protein